MNATVETCPERKPAVNLEQYRDPHNPQSWSHQMVSLIRDGHYREGYEILSEKMPFVKNQLRPLAERLAGKENYWTNLNTWIKKYIPGHTSQRILDVGCGVGGQAVEFAIDGHKTWGIDILHSMIEKGREVIDSLELSEQAHLQVGDIRRLEDYYDGSFFDVAIACDIFEHLDDPALMEVLRGLRQVVRPGGKIIIQTSPGLYYYWFEPDRKKLLALLAPLVWLPDRLFTAYVRWLDRWYIHRIRRESIRFYRHEYGHINCMDHVHLQHLLKKAGLQDINTFANHAHPGFKDEGCLHAEWTRILFSRKSIAARNVFGIATVPEN